MCQAEKDSLIKANKCLAKQYEDSIEKSKLKSQSLLNDLKTEKEKAIELDKEKALLTQNIAGSDEQIGVLKVFT